MRTVYVLLLLGATGCESEPAAEPTDQVAGDSVRAVQQHVDAKLLQAKVRACQARLALLRNALDMYRLDQSKYPDRLERLVTVVGGPQYLDELPLDPWGNAFHYQADERGANFTLLSYGRDGAPGGAGADADISSR